MADRTMRHARGCAASVAAGLPVMSDSRASVHAFRRHSAPLQFLDRTHDGPPDRRALGIASLKQLIGTLCRPDWRVLAVLVDQRFGGMVQGKLFVQF